MLSKAKIKLINSLKLGKNRKEYGLFVAEGTTNVIDFIKSGIEADEIFATAQWIASHVTETLNLKISETDENKLKKISFLKNPSPVIGLFKIPVFPPIDSNNITDLILMLDDIRDPGNLGTIIRTADWFGIRDIICSEKSVDAFNHKVVQASMGSLARVRIHYRELKSFIQTKPEYLKVFGTVLDGTSLVDIPKPQSALILIGSEAHGISKDILKLVDHEITIPSVETTGNSSAESLNVSIATAIICYEFRR